MVVQEDPELTSSNGYTEYTATYETIFSEKRPEIELVKGPYQDE